VSCVVCRVSCVVCRVSCVLCRVILATRHKTPCLVILSFDTVLPITRHGTVSCDLSCSTVICSTVTCQKISQDTGVVSFDHVLQITRQCLVISNTVLHITRHGTVSCDLFWHIMSCNLYNAPCLIFTENATRRVISFDISCLVIFWHTVLQDTVPCPVAFSVKIPCLVDITRHLFCKDKTRYLYRKRYRTRYRVL